VNIIRFVSAEELNESSFSTQMPMKGLRMTLRDTYHASVSAMLLQQGSEIWIEIDGKPGAKDAY